MSTSDIFFSHSAVDKGFVHQLATDLESYGLSVWLDDWSLKPGDSFATAIADALRSTRLLLIVMSPDYFTSAWTQQEWIYGLAQEAESSQIRVIPVLYRDCDVPTFLRTKQWVDFREPSQYAFTVRRLARVLRELLDSPSGITPTDATVEAGIESKPGERIAELDPASLSDLKRLLETAIKALGSASDSQPVQTVQERRKEEPNTCFIVMPFSVESLNIVYEDFVRPTLEDRCQLHVERGDDVFGSNVIMDDIARSVRRARLIVADLTGRNPNVFYEVGIAHALNKQVLLMTQSIDDVPFDLRHRRALLYDYSPRGCKKLEKDLYENVQGMLNISRDEGA